MQCSNGQGTFSCACIAPWADCDGNPANGCEADTDTDPLACGGCTLACTQANVNVVCVAGACGGACKEGFGDCNGAASADGCEVSLWTDLNNCGACGRDCGGPVCAKCGTGKPCDKASDCASLVCGGSPSVCQAPTCSDGVLNGWETDLDCGGSACDALQSLCTHGMGCATHADCAAGNCADGKCAIVALADDATCTEDSALVLPQAALLTNDLAANGPPLWLTAVQAKVGGTVTWGVGGVEFVPALDFNGDAEIAYSVADGGQSATGLLTVHVLPVNDAPVAVDDAFETPEDTPLALTAQALLANDSDVDGPALQVSAVQSPQHGTVTLVGAEMVFTPDADWNGTAGFDAVVSDGQLTSTSHVKVIVQPVDDAPLAASDALQTQEDTPLEVDAAALLANDTDIDGPALTLTVVMAPIHGSVVLQGGVVTFAPDPNFFGIAQFSYVVSDGQASAEGMVTVTVLAVNDAPVASPDLFQTNEDTPATMSASALLSNDLDADGPALQVTAVGLPLHGTVTLDGAGVLFVPDADFNGLAGFDYTITDGQASASAHVDVVVLAVNDPPVADGETLATQEDVPLLVTAMELLANDADIDSAVLTLVGVAAAQGGTVTLAGQTVTFEPALNFNGIASFDYLVSDGLATVPAHVQVEVAAVNDAPVPLDDVGQGNEDDIQVIDTAVLLANDVDVDGPTLQVVAVSNASHASVALAGTALTFTPEANYFGQAGFDYTVSDGLLSTTAHVAVTLAPVNDAPVAAPDTFAGLEDTPMVLQAADLLANDTDVEGSVLTLTAVSSANHCSVQLIGSDLTVTPSQNFNGIATFTYTVSDGELASQGVVSIVVAAVNDPPAAVGDSFTTAEDTTLALDAADLLANDVDIDSPVLSLTSVGLAVGGAVTLAGTSIAFVPAANFNGLATFTYTVSDGALSSQGTVTVQVQPVDDPPVAVADVTTAQKNTPKPLLASLLLANDSDVDGPALSVVGVGNAVNGTVVMVGSTITFSPASNFVGTASFDYTVSDGTLSAVGTVTVTVVACILGTDSDGDRLDNCYETGTNIYVSAQNTGTSPTLADTDGDAIKDGDEVLGTVAGLNLPALGANPLHKDIFLEYDWFDDSNGCTAHTHRPTAAQISSVTAAFAAAPLSNPDGVNGITLHNDYGQGGVFTSGTVVADADGVLVGDVFGTEFRAVKAANFAPLRQGYFHYVVLPHNYNTNSTSSGYAELPGNDLIVSLQCSLSTSNVANTIMHELGHNLNLQHGGNTGCNYKPNYNSVMNYRFQFNGIDNNCDPNGNGVLSYSTGTRITLTETALNENLGTCGTKAWDWNGNVTIEASVSANINAYSTEAAECGGTSTVLADYNDWAHIVFTGLSNTSGLAVGPQQPLICDNPTPPPDWQP